MGKGSVLRVLGGVKLPDELLTKLSTMLPNLQIAYYQHKPDYKSSIMLRIQSLLNAFFFVVDAYPLDPTFTLLQAATLKDHAIEYRVKLDSTFADIYKKILIKLVTLEKKILVKLDDLDKKKLADLDILLANLDKLTLTDLEQQTSAKLADINQKILDDLGKRKLDDLDKKPLVDLEKQILTDLHKQLEFFTAQLVGIILVSWEWPEGADPVTEAIECLNDGECYQMMLAGGRPNIGTLSSLDLRGKREFILQLDESIPAYYDQIIDELGHLKRVYYPKTPNWFLEFKEFQQVYFCHLKLENYKPQTILADFKEFLVDWEKIKLNSLNLQTDLAQIYSNTPPFPSWFNKLSEHNKEIIKALSGEPEKKIDECLKQFKDLLKSQDIQQMSPDQFKMITALPNWYWYLPHTQQYFLQHVLTHTTNVEAAVTSISSRLRTLPLPSNFGAHSLVTIKSDGQLVTHFDKRYRASHIASRDVLELPQEVQRRHSDSNLSKITERVKSHQTVLVQTYISPAPITQLVPFLKLPPDLRLFNEARAAVARGKWAKQTTEHNHPYNMAKYFYYTPSNDKDSWAFLQMVDPLRKKIEGLGELLEEYNSMLASKMGTATFIDYIGRELYLSSLEQLIILAIGGFSFGSCVSGKDRKGIELLHTDALIIFKNIFGKWPKFNDLKTADDQDQRACFVSIFTHLYITAHQQTMAELNAFGSKGIKTPYWYLPKDIVDSICKHLGPDGLINEDRLASDNEVKNISKSLKSLIPDPNELLGNLLARQLGEADCTRLYDSLGLLINELNLFSVPKTTDWLSFHKREDSGTPNGIDAIRTLMKNPQSGNENVERVGRIIGIVLSRPESGGSRKQATSSVYNRIRELSQPNEKPLNQRVDYTVTEWTVLFEESKRENNLSPSHS